MTLFASLVFALFCAGPPVTTYQAVVVDATTSRPLASVSVEDLQSGTGTATDQKGRFSLAGPTVHFRLRGLGFADLEATRTALAPGQVDTLRLLPQAILLSEVSVRPSKPVVLASVGTKPAKPRGTMLIPGAQYGILFQPAASLLPAVVQEISLRLGASRPPTAGRIRVRLVAPERGSTSTPSAHDLVPIAATYTAAELAALPDHVLRVDLSAYNLRLPATGFFVLIEGLATVPGESFVADKLVGGGKLLVVTATDPKDPATFHETDALEFPVVSLTASFTETATVTRLGSGKGWTYKNSGHDSKKNDNVDISLTILAE